MVEEEKSSWANWANKVLSDIEENRTDINKLFNLHSELHLELLEKVNESNKELTQSINDVTILITQKFAILETKAATSGAVWGGIFGIVSALFMGFIGYVCKKAFGG